MIFGYDGTRMALHLHNIDIPGPFSLGGAYCDGPELAEAPPLRQEHRWALPKVLALALRCLVSNESFQEEFQDTYWRQFLADLPQTLNDHKKALVDDQDLCTNAKFNQVRIGEATIRFVNAVASPVTSRNDLLLALQPLQQFLRWLTDQLTPLPIVRASSRPVFKASIEARDLSMLSQRDSPLLHTLNREWYHRSSLSARTAFWDLMAEVAGHFETILAQCEGGRLFGVVPRESPLRLKAEVHGAQTAWPSRFHVAQKWRGYEKAEPHSHECEKVSRYDNTGKGHRHKVQFSGDGKVSGGLALLVCPCLVIHGTLGPLARALLPYGYL